jgi:hypothetical protein
MNILPLIRKTGQLWKLILGFVIVLLGGVMFGLGIYQVNNSPDSQLLLLGTLLVFFGFFLACLLVRCPQCHTPWVWYAVTKTSFNDWTFWLFELDQCPSCGAKGI